MGWSKPLTAVEVSYIENSWPALSCAEIAEKLGRTPACVRNWVNKLGLRERQLNDARACARAGEVPSNAPPAPDGEDEGQDELAELRELKRLLKRSMREDAGPQSLPRLAAEYRETVKRISELEGGGNEGAGRNELAGLIGFVPVRPA